MPRRIKPKGMGAKRAKGKGPAIDVEAWLEANAILNVTELRGFLAALITGPELPTPGQWLDAICRERDTFAESDELEDVADALVGGVYNDVVEQLQKKDPAMTPAADDVDAITDWCGGYLEGLRFTDSWGLEEKHAAWAPLYAVAVLAGDEDAKVAFDQAREESARLKAMNVEQWLASLRHDLAQMPHTLWDVMEPRRKKPVKKLRVR